MSKDHYSKCEKQRELLRDLKKLEEKYDYYEKEIKKLSEGNPKRDFDLPQSLDKFIDRSLVCQSNGD